MAVLYPSALPTALDALFYFSSLFHDFSSLCFSLSVFCGPISSFPSSFRDYVNFTAEPILPVMAFFLLAFPFDFSFEFPPLG